MNMDLKSHFEKQCFKACDPVIKNTAQAFKVHSDPSGIKFSQKERQKWVSALPHHNSRIPDSRGQIFGVMTFRCTDSQSPHTISIQLCSQRYLDHIRTCSAFLDIVLPCLFTPRQTDCELVASTEVTLGLSDDVGQGSEPTSSSPAVSTWSCLKNEIQGIEYYFF